MIDSWAPLEGPWVRGGYLTSYPFPTHEEESADASSAFFQTINYTGLYLKA